MYANASLEQSRSSDAAMISRAFGPARLTAEIACVTSVMWTSRRQSASHQPNHSSIAAAPLDVVVT